MHELFINKNQTIQKSLTQRCRDKNLLLENIFLYTPVISHVCVYTLIAIDGSAVVYDRHQGHSSELYAAGGCLFDYGEQTSSVQYAKEYKQIDCISESKSDIYSFIYELEYGVGWLERIYGTIRSTRDSFKSCNPALLDPWCVYTHYFDQLPPSIILSRSSRAESRDGHSRESGFEQFLDEKISSKKDLIYLFFDGSLRYWLNNTSITKEQMSVIKTCLNKIYKLPCVCIWYNSMPHSHDLVCDHDITDGQFIEQCWKSGWSIRASCDYSLDGVLRVIYTHNGYEGAVCEYISSIPDMHNQVCEIVFDQVYKGFGYPVCLSEAHSHVCIRSDEKEAFHHYMRSKIGDNKEGCIKHPSYKLLRKKILPG
jgi:hypothetical protein